MTKLEKQISKLMSLVLRHKPEHLGVELDHHGWVEVDSLIAAMCESGLVVDVELLQKVVDENDKQRFSFSDDGLRIRANQGHSIDVDVELKGALPPDVLFHGTVAKFLESILQSGLKKMSRQHVHLSAESETAMKVGSRRGKPIVLEVDALRMAKEGHVFYLSANGVWLTGHVPAIYIEFPAKSDR